MTPDQQNELEFLRYFYDAAENAFGPASEDIYDNIKTAWLEAGEELPIFYERSFDGIEAEEDDPDDYNEDDGGDR